MNVNEIVLDGLLEIIEQERSYHLVLEEIEKNNNLSKEDYLRIKNNILGCLKYYYSFEHEITTSFLTKSRTPETVFLVSCLYEIRNAKDIPQYQLFNEIDTVIEDRTLRLEKKEVKEKLEFLKSNKACFDKFETQYENFCLENSFPQWIGKMWKKHFGEEEAMQCIKASRSKIPTALTINTLKISRNDLLQDKKFSPCLDSIFSCYINGKCRISELDEAKSGMVFVQDKSVHFFLDSIIVPDNSKVLHLGALTGGIASALQIRHNDNLQISAIYSRSENYVRSKAMFKRLGLNNINTYNLSLRLLPAYFGKTFDTVIVTPPNSSLGQIRKRPDLLLRLNQKDLDLIISREKTYLDEATSYLKDNGILAYMVQTLNKKEGTLLIEEFLNKHKNFELMISKQIFPYTYNSDGMFYAILRRKDD